MKINPVSSFKAYNNFSFSSNSINQTQNPIDTKDYKPVTAGQFLAFRGGYSMNLSLTLENLKDSSFPPDIKELAKKEVENGNPDDKTLIDIHKQKYGIINQMKTLDEVKKAFPEFKDVISADTVEYTNNSFIDDVKNDKLEWFDPDVDLTLQLLQMYWADGFSLSDLREYTNGKHIGGVLEKLNIPRMERTYGNVLKLSDKDYNERFTKEMSERQKGIAHKRAEKQDGVFVPRGPMSDETKKKISESNIKFYAEHPERITEMSDRMKQFYEEHPEQRERLSKVLTTAWGLREAKSVRKKMSKFFGKQDLTPEEFTALSLSKDKNTKNSLKEFWDRNHWAKEQWSKAMRRGWEIIKAQEVEEKDTPFVKPDIVIQIYPPSLKQDMNRWFVKNGYDVAKIKDPAIYMTHADRPMPTVDKYTHQAIVDYMSGSREDLVADMLQIGMLRAVVSLYDKYLSNPNTAKANPETAAACETIGYICREMVGKNGIPKVLTTPEITDVYARAMLYLNETNENKISGIMLNSLDESYQMLKYNDSTNIFTVTSRSLSIAKTFARLYPKAEFEQDRAMFSPTLS